MPIGLMSMSPTQQATMPDKTSPRTLHFSSEVEATAQQQEQSSSPAQSPRAPDDVAKEDWASWVADVAADDVAAADVANSEADEANSNADGDAGSQEDASSLQETTAITPNAASAVGVQEPAGEDSSSTTYPSRMRSSSGLWSKARDTIAQRTDR